MLGTRIKQLREKKGLTLEQLGQRLNISPEEAALYEQGGREPTAAMLVALSRELEVTTDYLLTGIQGQAGQRDVFARLLAESMQLTDEAPGNRRTHALTRQELAVLLVAMLTEP